MTHWGRGHYRLVMADANKPFHNPFGALGQLRDSLPGGPAAEPKPAAPPKKRTFPTAVLRLQRAGRGGKVVTVIEQLGLTAVEADEWVTALKTSLGTGGSVEGETIVMQGDQRRRLVPLLEARGVKRVKA